MRIIFAGTPEFSVPALRRLLASEHDILGAYTQPDRPAGRGRKLTASPVKTTALDAGIPVFQPVNLRGEEAVTHLSALEPDLLIVVAYGLILPQAILDTPKLGCWNLHASLLPRWRGAAPIQRAIEAGDEKTGVCLMQMAAGLDTGPVLARVSTAIRDDDSAASLHDRLAQLGADLLIDALAHPDDLVPEPQPETGIVYAHKIDKSEALLDWSLPAVTLWRRIRAFNPFPGARATVQGVEMKIWEADLVRGTGGTHPGRVLRTGADGIVVTTGDGLLRLTEIQPPGRRRMSAADFLNSHQGFAL